MKNNVLFFLKVGMISFGKMVATHYMFEEFVEKRKRLSKEEFFAINGFCKLLPGPSQTQTSIILGVLEGGKLLGILTGLMYLLPSFVLITLSAMLYFEIGQTIPLDKLNFGLTPFALALLIDAVLKLGKKALTSFFMVLILIISCIGSYFSIDIFYLIIGSVLISVIRYTDYKKLYQKIKDSKKLFSISLPLILSHPLIKLFFFFFKTGSLIYGGGLIILPMIQEEIIQAGILTEQEFLLGFTIGSATPGPVILTVAFIGYKIALSLGYQGIIGAVIAGVGVMLPSFLILISLSSIILKSRTAPSFVKIAQGIMPATLGAVAVSFFSLAKNSISNPFQIFLTIIFFILTYFTKINPIILLVIGGIIGFVIPY